MEFDVGAARDKTNDRRPSSRKRLALVAVVSVIAVSPLIVMLVLKSNGGNPFGSGQSGERGEFAASLEHAPTKEQATEAATWSQFRGPKRDNISPDSNLLTEWALAGPTLKWTARGLGDGYSCVSIAGGLVYTMGNHGDDEMLLALNLENGQAVWATRIGKAYYDGTGDGPRGTPAIDGDRVYALGANGDLVCADSSDGKEIWHKNILSEFGGRNIVWGISESVLIDDNRIVCTPGGSAATMVALAKTDGDVVWKCEVPGHPSAAYSSIIAVDVNGIRQYVNFTSNAVIGVRADNGQFLWKQTESTNSTANCSTPVHSNGSIFSASGYGTAGALFKLDSKGVAKLVYRAPKMVNHHGGMVALDGYLYATNERTLVCLDLKDGRPVWQKRCVGKGAIAYADGHLYVRSEGGPIALVQATADGYNEKGRFDQPNRSKRPAWSHPVVADGKLFLRDMDLLLCYDIRNAEE